MGLKHPGPQMAPPDGVARICSTKVRFGYTRGPNERECEVAIPRFPARMASAEEDVLTECVSVNPPTFAKADAPLLLRHPFGRGAADAAS